MKTLLFKEEDIIKILKESKDTTTRQPNNQNKNLKIGDQVKAKADHGRPPFAVLEITNIYYQSLKDMKLETIKRIGFKTKKEYTQQDYNRNINPDHKKIVIEFKIIENNITEYLEGY